MTSWSKEEIQNLDGTMALTKMPIIVQRCSAFHVGYGESFKESLAAQKTLMNGAFKGD